MKCWVHRRNVELSGESDLDGDISGDEKNGKEKTEARERQLTRMEIELENKEKEKICQNSTWKPVRAGKEVKP